MKQQLKLAGLAVLFGLAAGQAVKSLRRIGQTFASNLDRPALLELALSTAVDAFEVGGLLLDVWHVGRSLAEAEALDPTVPMTSTCLFTLPLSCESSPCTL